ncbi:hypothetical protein T440DRAFT_110294 [Plenodomus tracheiphilus IPT5]|uniref:Uncharacterized protein n=1 Tax=Plenodomus tracheiphilus IPT5 TaxID=1408161 RepID=A0A6A7B4N8_9PLEO|nr:hypothetical protein T440DRAFT_110294 [Plenodomus tracheiphilus IPT5]
MHIPITIPLFSLLATLTLAFPCPQNEQTKDQASPLRNPAYGYGAPGKGGFPEYLPKDHASPLRNLAYGYGAPGKGGYPEYLPKDHASPQGNPAYGFGAPGKGGYPEYIPKPASLTAPWTPCPNHTITEPNAKMCTRICAPESLKCGEGWASEKRGDCWTCCK